MWRNLSTEGIPIFVCSALVHTCSRCCVCFCLVTKCCLKDNGGQQQATDQQIYKITTEEDAGTFPTSLNATHLSTSDYCTCEYMMIYDFHMEPINLRLKKSCETRFKHCRHVLKIFKLQRKMC